MKIKKIFIICLSTILMLTLCLTVYAKEAPSEMGESVDGSTLLKKEYSEVVSNNVLRGNILNRGIARVTDNGNGVVNAYGSVIAAVICDKLQLTLVLQRYNGNSWVDVATKSYSDTNLGVLSRSFNTTVSKGYYYRVKAACVATDGGTVESQMPITDGIWID